MGDMRVHYRLPAVNSLRSVSVMWKTWRKLCRHFDEARGLKLEKIKVKTLTPTTRLSVDSNCLIIDALYGSGLSRPISAEWSDLFDQINLSGATIISIDIPSGLRIGEKTPLDTPIIRPTITYTLGTVKQNLLLPDYQDYSKKSKVLDIGLDKQFISDLETNVFYLTQEFVQSKLIQPQKYDHKGTYGHALIIGGSHGKAGAPILSSLAALKTGCGLLSLSNEKQWQLYNTVKNQFLLKNHIITNVTVNESAYYKKKFLYSI